MAGFQTNRDPAACARLIPSAGSPASLHMFFSKVKRVVLQGIQEAVNASVVHVPQIQLICKTCSPEHLQLKNQEDQHKPTQHESCNQLFQASSAPNSHIQTAFTRNVPQIMSQAKGLCNLHRRTQQGISKTTHTLPSLATSAKSRSCVFVLITGGYKVSLVPCLLS